MGKRDNEKGKKKRKDTAGIRKKRVINWYKLVIALFVVAILYMVAQSIYSAAYPSAADMSYIEFMQAADDGLIEQANIITTADTFTVKLKDGTIRRVINPKNDEFKRDILAKGVDIEVSKQTFSDALSTSLASLPFVIIMLLLVYYIMTTTMRTTNTLFKIFKDSDAITFEDVAGMDEIKEEVRFAIENLKNYDKLAELGARPTKGIILEGAPGTGKTLLARAIAGEAKVPLISTSGSDFIEMFVGLGAARVRALWELAEMNAPCVIFIDEIDAVGRRRRSSGGSGAETESNQTLNALLQKMDGLDTSLGILVVAATNLVSDLDPALMRPGRFDRHITVTPPRYKSNRDAITKIHMKGKKFEEGLDFEAVSKLMFGLTGAEIETALNEAVMCSLLHNKGGIIHLEDIDEAVMKLRVNGTIVSNTTETDKCIAAVHEAGHAIMNELLGKTVTKVSIVAYSSGVGGITVCDVDERQGEFIFKGQFEEDIYILLAGLIAEELIFGEHSIGCSNDLERATTIMQRMIYTYGMDTIDSNNILLVKEEQEKKQIVALKALQQQGVYIDNGEVRREVNDKLYKYYKNAYNLLSNYREGIKELGRRLVIEETILNPGTIIDRQVKDRVIDKDIKGRLFDETVDTYSKEKEKVE